MFNVHITECGPGALGYAVCLAQPAGGERQVDEIRELARPYFELSIGCVRS